MSECLFSGRLRIDELANPSWLEALGTGTHILSVHRSRELKPLASSTGRDIWQGPGILHPESTRVIWVLDCSEQQTPRMKPDSGRKNPELYGNARQCNSRTPQGHRSKAETEVFPKEHGLYFQGRWPGRQAGLRCSSHSLSRAGPGKPLLLEPDSKLTKFSHVEKVGAQVCVGTQ